LTAAEARSVLFVAPADGSTARLEADLGAIAAAPFRPRAEALAVVVGAPGQPYAFERVLEGPAFGVAQPGDAALLRAPLQAVAAAGDLTIVLDYAVFAVDHAGGTTLVATGERSTPAAGAPVGAVRDEERAYAVVTARGAALRLDAGSAEAMLLSRAPTYVLDGTLRLAGARGPLGYADGPRTTAARDVLIEGAFAIRPRAASARGAGLILDDAARDEVSVELQGDARSVRVDGQAWAPALPAPVRTASLVAIALGLLAAAWAAAQKTLPVLVPAYARLTGRDLLANRHRRALFEAVREEPFAHLRALQRSARVGFGTAAYHLDVLARQGAVASVRAAGREHFFVPAPGFPRAAMRSLALLAHPTRRRAAEHLAAHPGAMQAELAAVLGVGQGLLSRHLAAMVRAGLLSTEGGRVRRYRPTPLLAAWLGAEAARPIEPSRPAPPAPPAPLAAALPALARASAK
ncbi:MAG TPA: hypothetical protein VGR28_09945, partial [Candidatus Thermoplasmatota archaeon]|nr:hypothetical protein [Candidatus Thermoplasmatota archaeon]